MCFCDLRQKQLHIAAVCMFIMAIRKEQWYIKQKEVSPVTGEEKEEKNNQRQMDFIQYLLNTLERKLF